MPVQKTSEITHCPTVHAPLRGHCVLRQVPAATAARFHLSVLREWFYCFPACVVHSWVSVWLEITGNTVSSWKHKKCRQGQVCVFCMFNYLISLFKLRLSLGLLDPAYWTNFLCSFGHTSVSFHSVFPTPFSWHIYKAVISCQLLLSFPEAAWLLIRTNI